MRFKLPTLIENFQNFRVIQRFHAFHDIDGRHLELESDPALRMQRCQTIVCGSSPSASSIAELFSRGYAVAPDPRDPNEWDERHQEDPPTGLVRLKGVRLGDLEDENADFDEDITFSIEEFWSPNHQEQAQSERGYYLVTYSYHAHWHGIDQRWDYDPIGHPDMPYHFHPPGQRTRLLLEGPVSPGDALDEFERWIATET